MGNKLEDAGDVPANLPPLLRALGREVHVARDGWVFRKGDSVRAVYFVIDGEIRLSRFSKSGGEIALHRAGTGDFFAEAALNAARYQCNAIASRDTTLVAFPAGKMRMYLAKDPQFAREWATFLARQLHGARARLERLAIKSAAERVLHYIQVEGTGPHSVVRLAGTVKDLAQELGLTHEALYRTLARLKRDRVIGQEDGTLFLP
jgi:CRP/FNR family transcriptional regulator, dissimilatory nitrate respiration regulator